MADDIEYRAQKIVCTVIMKFLKKYIEQPSYKLTMTEVSRNLRNIFLAKIPPIVKVEAGFLST